MPDIRNLAFLATNIEARCGSNTLLLEVVGSTSCASFFHGAAFVSGHQVIFVIGQLEHCGSFATDPPGMAFAKPLSFQMLLASFSATRGPLAPGSCMSLRCRRLLERETFSFCWVSNGHVVSLREPLSANFLALDLFAMALAIVEAV